MAHQHTALGAQLLMASAALLVGLAGWNIASSAPRPVSYAIVPPPAEARVPVAEATPPMELPTLPAPAPMPAIDQMAINIALPAPREAAAPEPTTPRRVATRVAPRKAPAPAIAQPAPRTPAPALVRVAESGTRA